MDYPKFKKQDDDTIVVIDEVQKHYKVESVVQAKIQLEEKIKALQAQLKEVVNLLNNAKKLGLDTTPKPKDKDVAKKN